MLIGCDAGKCDGIDVDLLVGDERDTAVGAFDIIFVSADVGILNPSPVGLFVCSETVVGAFNGMFVDTDVGTLNLSAQTSESVTPPLWT